MSEFDYIMWGSATWLELEQLVPSLTFSRQGQATSIEVSLPGSQKSLVSFLQALPSFLLLCTIHKQPPTSTPRTPQPTDPPHCPQPLQSCSGTPASAMSAALTTNVDMRLLRTTKFPPEFNVKVDMTKINTTVIKKWVTDELARILQNEDDVVTELVSNIIEETRYVCSGARFKTQCHRESLLTTVTAEHQGAADLTDRIPRQRCGAILHIALETMLERSGQSARHTERASTGESTRDQAAESE